MKQEQQDFDCLMQIRASGKQRTEGISTLYRKYAPQMKRYFMRQGKSFAQAEDLLQDVFVQVVRNIDSYRDEGSFSAWLWTIARNRLISEYRKSVNHASEIELDENLIEDVSIDSAHNSDQEALQKCVHDAFERFSLQYHERAHALILSAVYGWTIEEMSSFLGRTVAATREYLSQSRKKLRPFLKPCFDFLTP